MSRGRCGKYAALKVIESSAIRRILPSSGSSNAVGTITFSTALGYAPANGEELYVALPAGVVTAGSQGTGAGLYAATGLGTNNSVQISGTGIQTANGAYTQTTGTPIVLDSAVVIGGSIGRNGALRVVASCSIDAAVSNKNVTVVFGGTIFGNANNSSSARLASGCSCLIVNRNSESRQVGSSTYTYPGGSSSGALATASVNTSLNQTLMIRGQIPDGTAFIVLESVLIELLLGA